MTAALTLAVVIDVSVALVVGLLSCWALRHRPAALRHWVLAASLVVAGASPLLEVTLPRLELPLLTTTAQVTSEGAALSSEPAPAAAPAVVTAQDAPRVAWMPMIVALWAAGCGLLLASLLAGFARLLWMTRRCQPVRSNLWRERTATMSALYGIRRSVVVLESPDRALLLTWGLVRPRIIVPAAAASWNAERIDVVLGHELAHIARCDWAVQVAAETLRAVHWFNPLMWLACRTLRVESEQACDDDVLRRGVAATEYASHLLAVARHVLTAGGGWASAPAVAHASTLERRIAAMLNVSSNREPVTRAARFTAVLATLAMTIPVAAATLTERIDTTPFVPGAARDVALAAVLPTAFAPVAIETPAAEAAPARTVVVEPAEVPAKAPVVVPAVESAQQKPATLMATIRDATGGVIPGVLVVLTDAAGSRTSTTTDANGQVIFRTVVPGQYQFTARLPGFRALNETLNLADGQNLRRDLLMPIGQIVETLVVTCAPAAVALVRGDPVPILAPARRSTVPRLFPAPRDAAAPPAFAAQVVPVRIGGNIKAPQQVKKVPPRCPSVTPGAGLIVILESTLGVDGLVKDVKVLRPSPADDKQTGYVQAAVDAVRQWEYTPTLLNNVPTAVIMTVTVTFVVQASPN